MQKKHTSYKNKIKEILYYCYYIKLISKLMFKLKNSNCFKNSSKIIIQMLLLFF